MNFYIKEWANNTATLMTDNGQVLWTFPSKAEACMVCREYYALQFGKDVQVRIEASGQPQLSDLIVC